MIIVIRNVDMKCVYGALLMVLFPLVLKIVEASREHGLQLANGKFITDLHVT